MAASTFTIKLRDDFEQGLAEEAHEAVMALIETEPDHPEVLVLGAKGVFRTAAFRKAFNRTFERQGIRLSGWYGDAYLIDADKPSEEIRAACPQFTFVGAYPVTQ